MSNLLDLLPSLSWHDWVWIMLLVTYPLQWVGALIEVWLEDLS